VFGIQQFFEVVAWVGAITALLLATQALVNHEIKKVLAYSTGSQIGYMMMALGIAGLSTNFVDGYTAGFFHLMSHAMFKASLFMGAGAILHSVGSRFMTDMGGVRKNMKKTFAFMLLSSLSLAGAPLITSGFWSKDAIFASVLESGYTYSWALFGLAVIVAIMTSFYTFRMLGMAFFGQESRHISKMKDHGHHIHEVGARMWVPFGILAIATISIGLIGFIFEPQIHHVFSEYLSGTYGISAEHGVSDETAHSEEGGIAIGIPSDGESTLFGLNPTAAIASIVAFGIGGILGYIFYIGRKVNPEIISKNIVTRSIWKFLNNRWYLNSVLYIGAVYLPLFISRLSWRYFENVVIDGLNPALQHSMSYLSLFVKRTQTGITQTYLFVFAAGILFVIFLLLAML
jgi:NADH-quinone oxidoreductase subunit L